MQEPNDPSHWVLGIFYYNKADKRILVPKRLFWMGWTINFANPYSVIVLITLTLLAILPWRELAKFFG